MEMVRQRNTRGQIMKTPAWLTKDESTDDQPLLTVIVPVYNAEKDLRGCIESLFEQTRPIRILLANDGSTDATKEIMGTFAVAFPKIVQAMHLRHAGPTATRQSAVDYVRTPYLSFVDADDCIEPVYTDVMLAAAQTHDADIVFCPYACVYDGVQRHESYGGEEPAFARERYPIRKHPELLLQVPVFFWGKVYRTAHFLGHCEFASEESSSVADIPTILPFLVKTPRIVKVNQPLYRYSISSDSMCRISKQEMSRLVALRTLQQRLNDIGLLPEFLPPLYAINRCYLYDQLEKLTRYCDPVHQHRVVREYFKHLDGTLPGWRPHPFHPSFYAAYWHWVVALNALQTRWRTRK